MQFNNKIIDCFIFYNELDILDMRLHELDEHVDLFVLIEAKHTFSLQDKPLYYQENKSKFDKFNHKIKSFVIEDLPNVSGVNWDREWYSRNYINRALNELNTDNEAIILISDVDEIPNPKKFDEIKFRLINNRVSKLVLCQRFFYYNFECENKEKNRQQKSRNTIAILYHNLKKTTPQYLRGHRGTFKRVVDGGWHCSYFGGINRIIDKIKQFSHQEYNNEKYLEEGKILKHIKEKTDIFDRTNEKWEFNDVSQDLNLPKYYYLLKN